MTKIYIYCLFDTADTFQGVYSSLKAVHRDALRLANRGDSKVQMMAGTQRLEATLINLRNTFKGLCDVHVDYRTNRSLITIYKTRLKE